MKEMVLVSGGAGYIGSHTAVELINAGYDVVVADNLSNADMSGVEGVRKITGVDVPFVEVDCCDREALKSRLFEHGTVLAMIDRFSSGRLGIWVNYMANFNWLGHVSTYLEEVKPHRLHAHNTYVSNIYNYGLIGGGAYLLWNIGLLAESVRKSLTGKKIYILPALWIALTLTGMLTETLFFVYPLPFIMLFLQYPLLVRIDGEDGEAVTGKDGKKCIKEKRKKEKRKNE
mgnify:CR=1 FL=1